MTPMLQFDDLHFSYPELPGAPSRPPALRGISLTVPQGCRLAILGANGSGKSTLLLHANGSLRPKAGRVLQAGKPVDYSRQGLHALRRRVSLVLQEPDEQLFAGSLRQDVSFGPFNLGLPEAEVARRTDEALRILELADLAHLPPHQLSHGQKKRAVIAGALAMQPELLALDEPTAGLDPRSIGLLARNLDELHQRGITIILSTHDIDFAFAWADTVAIMQEGKLSRVGSPRDVLGDEERLQRAGLRMPFQLLIERNTSHPESLVPNALPRK